MTTVRRKARVLWRRHIGGQDVDTEYAEIDPGGEAVVHEQVSFPGEVWAVEASHDRVLLALYVATSEREQVIRVDAAARDAASRGPVQPDAVAAGSAPANEDDDPDLAAAIRASLETAPVIPSATAQAAASRRAFAAQLLEANNPQEAARHFVANCKHPASQIAVATAKDGGTATDNGFGSVEAACHLSRRLCEAHRTQVRLRNAVEVARIGANDGDKPCRLQYVLEDGSRHVETLPSCAPMAAVATLACLLLLRRCSELTEVADACDSRSEAATHVLVCTAPRLRLLLHVGHGLASECDSQEAAGDLHSRGLAPSATLRLQQL
uniref:Uncharacterized protein n=1 Tax=Haptolina brevifila TaxID=156173 RepID=A0A7S2JEL4_9EUKA